MDESNAALEVRIVPEAHARLEQLLTDLQHFGAKTRRQQLLIATAAALKTLSAFPYAGKAVRGQPRIRELRLTPPYILLYTVTSRPSVEILDILDSRLDHPD